MNHRKFGRLGWQVSEIGFGAWAIGAGWGKQDDSDSVRALHKALDLGCNFIDTAQGYGKGHSERIIGQVLKDRKGERVYVATKIPPKGPGVWPPAPHDRIEDRFPEAYVRERVEGSLKNLQTDCLDLLQVHTWTRAWNRHPAVLELLQVLKKEGKLLGIGISTPEQDQNALVELMRKGWLDSVQLIYNIFEQEPAAELLPAALEHQVAVIVRVVFDEGSLTGKFTEQTKFEEGDFRGKYFAGDRIARTVSRVKKIKAAIGSSEPDVATAALKFALKPAAVSNVIPGMRNERQAELNCAIGSQPPMSDELEVKLRGHAWLRAMWYHGKD